MSFWGASPSVAEQAAKARRFAKSLEAQGQKLHPVCSSGRQISQTFWGQSWCRNLEAYSDYATRLPRGRSYLKHGSVIDLQIARGRITALVSGSELYRVEITIVPLKSTKWESIRKACLGKIETIMDLLSGNLAGPVMKVVTNPGNGLFPGHHEIRHACSCPDSARLCKHQAATLYGVAVRLDEEPSVLFTLRGVKHHDLVKAISSASIAGKISKKEMIPEKKLASIFGVEVDLD